MKLTAAVIPALKALDEKREQVFRDTVVRGLLLEAHPTGRKTFVAWGIIKGTDRAARLTLGTWQPGVYDLADAREDARDALRRMAKGHDPAAERRQKREAGTFGQLAESYLKDAQIRQATRESWEALLRHERLAGLRARPTGEVTRVELVRLFDKIRDRALAEGRKAYSANRSLEAVRRVFSWAVEKGLLPASPCVGIKKPTKEQPRRRPYSDVELGAIVRALRADQGVMAAATFLAVYTGVRIEAALGAPWREFDLDAGTWLITGDRTGTKNGLPWLVPLPGPAIALLRERSRDTEWVFGTRSSKTGEPIRAPRDQKAILRLRKQPGVPADFRPHDARSILNTWLASRAGGAEPLEVRDAVLGHAKRGLEQSYNQHAYFEEKRDALARWAAHVGRVATMEPKKVLVMPGLRA